MICYNCGGILDRGDRCPSCGADVRLYKIVIALSDIKYNEGLEKAAVRNMSGAVSSLRESLRLYSMNIQARNLLGLIYYETGEIVAALSQWVISKNLQPDDNPADDYLEAVRSDPGRLENSTQTIRKFNIALRYCGQNSLDLAVIQLRKVLSMNPGYVKAHQLLALLYLNDKNPQKARVEARRTLNLDSGNVAASRYLKEANAMLLPGEGGDREENSDAIRYQSGNEMIIQPAKGFRAGYVSILASILVGILLGIAASIYLILPSRIKNINSTNQQMVAAISEESDAKSAKIAEFEHENILLSDKLEALNEELEALKLSASESTSTDVLMKAVAVYLEDPANIEEVAQIMEGYSHEEAQETSTDDARALYTSFMILVREELTKRAYDKGYEAYQKKDYVTAADNLSRAFDYDDSAEDALFYLGNTYYESGDTDNAKEIYSRVIRLFPDTKGAEDAEAKLAEINNS